MDLKHLAGDMGISARKPAPENVQMANIFMTYRNEQKADFEQFLHQISARAKELGIEIKPAGLNDLRLPDNYG